MSVSQYKLFRLQKHLTQDTKNLKTYRIKIEQAQQLFFSFFLLETYNLVIFSQDFDSELKLDILFFLYYVFF